MVIGFSDLHFKLIEKVIVEVVILFVTTIHGEKWIIRLLSYLFGYLLAW